MESSDVYVEYVCLTYYMGVLADINWYVQAIYVNWYGEFSRYCCGYTDIYAWSLPCSFSKSVAQEIGYLFRVMGLGSFFKGVYAKLTGTKRVSRHPSGSPERGVTRRNSPNRNRSGPSQSRSVSLPPGGRGRSHSLNSARPKELTDEQFYALSRVQQRAYSRMRSQRGN